MGFKFGCIKLDYVVFGIFDICQFLLVGCLCDFLVDIVFGWVVGQDNFGIMWIRDSDVKYLWIVIVEIMKFIKCVWFVFDLVNQCFGFCFVVCFGDIKDIVVVWIFDEMGIEGFVMVNIVIYCIQVGFEEI